MTQDVFNKIVTSTLLVFFMAMYTLSWYTGRTVDWNQLLVFIIPTVNHIIHQIVGAQVTTTNVQAQKDIQVATITKDNVSISNGGQKNAT